MLQTDEDGVPRVGPGTQILTTIPLRNMKTLRMMLTTTASTASSDHFSHSCLDVELLSFLPRP